MRSDARAAETSLQHLQLSIGSLKASSAGDATTGPSIPMEPVAAAMSNGCCRESTRRMSRSAQIAPASTATFAANDAPRSGRSFAPDSASVALYPMTSTRRSGTPPRVIAVISCSSGTTCSERTAPLASSPGFAPPRSGRCSGLSRKLRVRRTTPFLTPSRKVAPSPTSERCSLRWASLPLATRRSHVSKHGSAIKLSRSKASTSARSNDTRSGITYTASDGFRATTATFIPLHTTRSNKSRQQRTS